MRDEGAFDIVIIDDDVLHARHLRRLADAHSLATSSLDPRRARACDAPAARMALIKSERDVELVGELTRHQPSIKTIVLGAANRVERVIACMRAGASDVLPVDLADAEGRARLQDHLGRCKADSHSGASVDTLGLAGTSDAMNAIRAEIFRLGQSEATCLIEGPTGAGKELVALGLHHRSKRASGPLVAINCGAIPDDLLEGELFGYEKGAFSGAISSYPGKLALADGGTLFLDEIGELSAAGQVKLLRALEARQCYRLGGRQPASFDVRVIAATNRDLAAEVAAGRFRSDLYYRIAVARIPVPALARRRDDIVPLARHFLQQLGAPRRAAGPIRIAPCAEAALVAHDWPGNARELRNVVEVALIGHTGTELTAGDLPIVVLHTEADGAKAANRPMSPGSFTDDALADALDRCGGNKSEAARLLGCSRMTLYRHLQRS